MGILQASTTEGVGCATCSNLRNSDNRRSDRFGQYGGNTAPILVMA